MSSILAIRAIIMKAMLAMTLFTDAYSSLPPDIQYMLEGMWAAQGACFFIIIPFVIVLDALVLGGMIDPACLVL